MKKEPTGLLAVLTRVTVAFLMIPMLLFDIGFILIKGHKAYWIMKLNQAARGLDIEKPLDEFFEKYANSNYPDFVTEDLKQDRRK